MYILGCNLKVPFLAEHQSLPGLTSLSPSHFSLFVAGYGLAFICLLPKTPIQYVVQGITQFRLHQSPSHSLPLVFFTLLLLVRGLTPSMSEIAFVAYL